VTGVVAALEPHNGICVLAQQVNDLAFTLVTPLGAQYNDAFSHVSGNLCLKGIMSE
jgi:hypothetical protein